MQAPRRVDLNCYYIIHRSFHQSKYAFLWVMRPALIHRTAMINFEKEEFIMASIVQRNKSFSVVYRRQEKAKVGDLSFLRSGTTAEGADWTHTGKTEREPAKSCRNTRRSSLGVCGTLWTVPLVLFYLHQLCVADKKSHSPFFGGDAADRIQSENHCNAVQQDTLSAELDIANADRYP